jgi:hypothetical protein
VPLAGGVASVLMMYEVLEQSSVLPEDNSMLQAPDEKHP